MAAACSHTGHAAAPVASPSTASSLATTTSTTGPPATTPVGGAGAGALPASGPGSGRVTKAGGALRLGSFFPLGGWGAGHGWALDPPTAVHGEAAMTPAADFELTVTVPDGYQVLATGTPDGHGRWSATAVPDLAIAVGHFRTATAT